MQQEHLWDNLLLLLLFLHFPPVLSLRSIPRSRQTLTTIIFILITPKYRYLVILLPLIVVSFSRYTHLHRSSTSIPRFRSVPRCTQTLRCCRYLSRDTGEKSIRACLSRLPKPKPSTVTSPRIGISFSKQEGLSFRTLSNNCETNTSC